MNTKKLVASLEARAFKARVPFYKVRQRAHVSSATIARWKGGKGRASATVLGKLERALDEIEAERGK